jgi:hypothetical protein
MLYGRSGIGKTAVAWQMAQAIQTGQSIWGMPTKQTNVLFMELDMPDNLAQNRWADADPAFVPEFSVAFDEVSLDYRQFLTPYPDDRHKEVMDKLQMMHQRQQFGVVFIDALREVVPGDLSASGIARRVYDAFKTVFPGATIVFIHHERKGAAANMGPTDPLHAAAGSMEFINVAQVAVQFHRRGRETWLDHGKTQASATFDPLPISLRDDGVHVYHRQAERLKAAEEIIANNPNAKMRELDSLIGARLGISDRAARVIRCGLMQAKQNETESSDAGTSNPIL